MYHSEFLPLEWSLVHERQAGSAFAKVLVEKATDRVLGLHFCGPNAGEVIQGYAAALKVRTWRWCSASSSLSCLWFGVGLDGRWTPIHPSIHPSTHPSIHPSIHPPTHPSMRTRTRQVGIKYAQLLGTVGIHPTNAEELVNPLPSKSAGASSAKAGC